jgi:hypothetical protein
MVSAKLNKITQKVYARKCHVNEINDIVLVRNFLNTNHIQGYTNFTKSIGIFFNNELLSIMTFMKRKDEWELNRFCSKLNILVVGGASKLFHYFISNFKGSIFTFSDKSYSSGDLYLKLGFKKEYDIKPDYRYLVDGIRKHKFNFRKAEKSVIYPKVWDAGKVKYYFKTLPTSV